MDIQLERRYGLPTAICMVVGIVMGSGVFFKAEAVLQATGGDMALGVAAWLIVGAIMVVCTFTFSTLSSRYQKVNGVVDYAEAALGPRYGYYVGWFMAIIYYPTLTSVLAWLSARYFCVLLGWDITGGPCMAIACFFLCMSFAGNALSPWLAGRFQVATTVIKMVPLLLMAVVGTVAGLSSGQLAANFSAAGAAETSAGASLMASVVAVAFAYEGWIIATSINAELKDPKRTLPLALVIGSVIVVATYLFYYVGLSGAVTTGEMMESGEQAAKLAFQRLFGQAAGTGVFVLIVVSCLGVLNGLMLACCRGMYAIAVRGEGPRPELFAQVDLVTHMPVNSSVLGLALCGFWLLYFYGANLTESSWFGPFTFDTSEIPIITLYAFYIPIFFQILRRERDLGFVRRVLTPVLALCGCVFMVYAAFAAHGAAVWYYLVVFGAVMLLGAYFGRKRKGR